MQPVSNPISQPCAVTMSSSCVIWPGPDIPCINLCKGESVTKAIASLADKICNAAAGVVDISTIDPKCLVAEGDPAPTDIVVLTQLIIDKVCSMQSTEVAPEEIIINLPVCIQYVDGEGSTVTQLPLPDYAALLGNEICEIIQEITTINQTLENHEQRITTLENATDPETGLPTITSACLTGTEPGQQIPMNNAIEQLESYLCDLKSTLGENQELAGIPPAQCAGIDSAPSLANPGINMSSVPGWTVNASNVAQSLTNLWLVVCDIRQKLENC